MEVELLSHLSHISEYENDLVRLRTIIRDSTQVCISNQFY